jgi:hypothetical protein
MKVMRGLSPAKVKSLETKSLLRASIMLFSVVRLMTLGFCFHFRFKISRSEERSLLLSIRSSSLLF